VIDIVAWMARLRDGFVKKGRAVEFSSARGWHRILAMAVASRFTQTPGTRSRVLEVPCGDARRFTPFAREDFTSWLLACVAVHA
jgi:hypothetical protein